MSTSAVTETQLVTSGTTVIAGPPKIRKLKPARKQVKAGEVEIGICSSAEDEDPKTRGLWRVMDDAEVERHLVAYGEKD